MEQQSSSRDGDTGSRNEQQGFGRGESTIRNLEGTLYRPWDCFDSDDTSVRTGDESGESDIEDTNQSQPDGSPPPLYTRANDDAENAWDDMLSISSAEDDSSTSKNEATVHRLKPQTVHAVSKKDWDDMSISDDDEEEDMTNSAETDQAKLVQQLTGDNLPHQDENKQRVKTTCHGTTEDRKNTNDPSELHHGT